MEEFSFFKGPITNKIPAASISLKDAADNIKNDTYLAEMTTRLRGIQDKDKRREYKNTFCYVTFGGTFSERRANAILSPSGLICADLDHVGTNGQIKDLQGRITQHLTPALMFVSPSGDGLKVIFKIDLEQGEYSEYYAGIEKFFNDKLNLQIDKSCKDISRATYLCHDPEVFYSDQPTVINKDFFSPLEIIADGGCTFDNLKSWLDKKMTFTPGSRNAYITQLAGACNRLGLKEEYTLSQLRTFAEDDFTAREIEATVRSIYNNSSWHGTAVNLDDLEDTKPEEKTAATPLLPIEGLPKQLQDIINECARVYGTHRDFWTGAVLMASALALGNNYRVKTQYTNGAVLWLGIVAKTGTGKTEPLRFAFRPFHDRDDEAIRNYEKELSEYEHYRRIDKKQREEEGIVINADVPSWRQYVINDITPEGIFYILKNNPRGISLVRDELRGWIDDFGRYNKSGEESTWLTSWSEQPITINRKNDKPIKINRPFICVAGGLQPSELAKLAAGSRAVNGFMQRICFVYPDKADRPYFNEDELRHKFIDDYDNYITELLSFNNPEPENIRLDEEATRIFKDFNNRLSDEINQLDDEFLTGICAKLPIIALRLALVIHFSNQAASKIIYPMIRGESMAAAVSMAEYFKITGAKVGRDLNNNTMIGLDKKNVARWLNEEIGWNHEQLAKILKVSRQYVAKLLKN